MSKEPIQEALFSVVDDAKEIGYSTRTAVEIAGISYRQLDYWARTKLVAPSICEARGSGTRRLYSYRDLVVLKIVKGLLETGISLQNIRRAISNLQDLGVDDLSTITLVSDGHSVYECRSSEEIFDLLSGGQGVFGIGVPNIVRELNGRIVHFEGHSVTESGNITSADEFARRRAERQRAANS